MTLMIAFYSSLLVVQIVFLWLFVTYVYFQMGSQHPFANK
jgi:hypothetical protein